MSYPQLPEPAGSEPSSVDLSTARDPRLGVAYAVSVRNEGGGDNALQEVVLSYRLRRLGPDGRQLPPLQVEMRGPKLQGMVADGDLIQAPDPLPASGSVRLGTVTNLTTGAPVTTMLSRGSKGCLIAFVVIVALMALVMIGVFVTFLATSP